MAAHSFIPTRLLKGLEHEPKDAVQCEYQNDVNPKHSQFHGHKILGDFRVSANDVCHEFPPILSKPRRVEQMGLEAVIILFFSSHLHHENLVRAELVTNWQQ